MSRATHLRLSAGDGSYRLGRVGLEVQFAAADRLRMFRDTQFERRIAACSHLEGEALHRALELAFAGHQKIVADAEVLEWLQTLEGTVFILWRALGKHHPDLTEKEARDVYLQFRPLSNSLRLPAFGRHAGPSSKSQSDFLEHDRGVTR